MTKKSHPDQTAFLLIAVIHKHSYFEETSIEEDNCWKNPGITPEEPEDERKFSRQEISWQDTSILCSSSSCNIQQEVI
jgi:hypothetical protein